MGDFVEENIIFVIKIGLEEIVKKQIYFKKNKCINK